MLIALALWLEYHFMIDPRDNGFVFGIYGKDDLEYIKELAYKGLRSLFKNG